MVREIGNRLRFLNDLGLNYLSLDRSAETLSGGEAQRIRLASQIGSGLTGVMYVLDEPSIGLHQRDNDRLIGTLQHLRDLGNSVLVVEHDEDMIRAAEWGGGAPAPASTAARWWPRARRGGIGDANSLTAVPRALASPCPKRTRLVSGPTRRIRTRRQRHNLRTSARSRWACSPA